MSLIINCDDAYQYYRDFLYEHGKKGATFVNVEKILKWKQVEINLKPLDIQSLTKAIIFELFYYINGYFRV